MMSVDGVGALATTGMNVEPEFAATVADIDLTSAAVGGEDVRIDFTVAVVAGEGSGVTEREETSKLGLGEVEGVL